MEKIEVWAELWRDGSYKRTVKIVIKQEDQLGLTVNGKKAQIESYDAEFNHLRLQDWSSGDTWFISEKLAAPRDPAAIYKQLSSLAL